MKAINTPKGQEKARKARLTRLEGKVQAWHPVTNEKHERRTVQIFICGEQGLSITKTENLTNGARNYEVELQSRFLTIEDLDALAIAIQAARDSAVFAEALQCENEPLPTQTDDDHRSD